MWACCSGRMFFLGDRGEAPIRPDEPDHLDSAFGREPLWWLVRGVERPAGLVAPDFCWCGALVG